MGLDNFLEILEEVKDMSQDELTQLVHAIHDRKDYLRAKDLEGFRIGDKVSFESGKGMNKETYTGIVEKINLKTIGIKEEGRPWVRWRCSTSLLTKVKETK